MRRSLAVAGPALAALAALLVTPSAVAAEQVPPHVEQWWYDAMGLAEAHREHQGEGVTVAVLDNYVDTTVPDLQGADVNLKTNCLGEPVPEVFGGVETDHGTSMVTAIAGQGVGNAAGGRGVLGAAPRATVNFYSVDSDPTNDRTYDCAIHRATVDGLVTRAVKDGADVISISAGGGVLQGEEMQRAIDRAIDEGVVVVAAAGQVREGETPGPMVDPAGYPGVVGVVAVDREGRPYALNNTANERARLWPTLAAPGVDVPMGGFPGGREDWVSGVEREGTSGATAIAAGAFAVLKSAHPDATGNQLVQTFIHHPSRDEDDGELRYTDALGYGRIALDAVAKVDPAGYPDENPTRQWNYGPEAVVAKFPACVYDPERDPSDWQRDDSLYDREWQAADYDPCAASSSEAEGAPAAPVSDGGADPRGDEGSGPPVAALAAGGALGLLVLAGAVVLARRRAGAEGPDTSTRTRHETRGSSHGS